MERKPNIVLILTDDQGYGDLSRTGNGNLSTPRIDSLAAAGAVLDHFYVQPLCAPTRAELLTGRYFSRTGVRGVTRRAERMDLEEKTVADLFLENGYRTGCFGKWHSGAQYPYHPNGRGFEEFFGYCCGHWSHYFDSTVERNGKEERCKGYLTDVLTDRAIDFIRDNRERPFFCYIPLNTPHSPFQVPDGYFDRFKEKEIRFRADDPKKEDLLRTRSVLAMCENIDWNVGRVADAVSGPGLEENTILVYLSDNGPNGVRWNAGMSGIKGDAEEGGVRSPCSVTWPAHIRPGTQVGEIAGAIDLLPTLCSLAGIPVRGTKPLDGLDIAPLLFGAASAHPERLLFAKQLPRGGKPAVLSVRSNRFRAGGNLGGLYEMGSDIGQRVDVTREHPEEAERLRKAMRKFEQSLPSGTFDPVIPVGYREFPHTDLPAQDADLTGGVTWSSIHPNASFLVNWRGIEDRISWTIEVKTPGTYRATLMYTCPESSVGTELELTALGRNVAGVIRHAHESRLKDKEDRLQRDESYEKEFFPMILGDIELAAGKGPVTLQAVRKTGPGICDLRALRLELLPSTRGPGRTGSS